LVGQRVCVFGTSRADLNGRQGVAEAFDAALGRYRVQMPTSEAVQLLAMQLNAAPAARAPPGAAPAPPPPPGEAFNQPPGWCTAPAPPPCAPLRLVPRA
jgi:hypothetical protein